MFITAIEQLAAKKCFGLAFEVFFGILLQISESYEIELTDVYKEAIALFTCAMQSKTLRELRELQEIKSFYTIINEISEFILFENIHASLAYIKEILSAVLVRVHICEAIPESNEKGTGMHYTHIVILKDNNSYYVLYEARDFMDDEELIEYEEEIKAQLESEEKLRKEELETQSSMELEQTPVSESALDQVSRTIAAIVLKCGSYFCFKCYKMLESTAMFLKCSVCCESAHTYSLPVPSNNSKKSIPHNSLCSSCHNAIGNGEGEIIRCICCFIRNEYLHDFSDTDCVGCCSPQSNTWVDTRLGKRYQLNACALCKKNVKYEYLLEACAYCHYRICLQCLRKNSFITSSICSECHNKRKISPLKKKRRKLFDR